MKKLILLFTAIALSSCADKKIRCYVCDKEEKEKVQNFVSSNIKNANNMSDEEMEDVIEELTDTAIKLNCRQKYLDADFNRNLDYKSIEKNEDETVFPYIY